MKKWKSIVDSLAEVQQDSKKFLQILQKLNFEKKSILDRQNKSCYEVIYYHKTFFKKLTPVHTFLRKGDE